MDEDCLPGSCDEGFLQAQLGSLILSGERLFFTMAALKTVIRDSENDQQEAFTASAAVRPGGTANLPDRGALSAAFDKIGQCFCVSLLFIHSKK